MKIGVFVQNQSMHVYFFRAGMFVKIGKATNIDKRLRAVQAQCPLTISVIGVIRCRSNAHSLSVERRIHETVGWRRAHHEWFHAPEDLETQVRAIVDRETRSIRSAEVGVTWVYG